MKLLSSDWIYLHEGRLHAPPFVARCFQYAIRDNKSSLLVYHKPHISSGGDSFSNTEATKFSETESTVDEIYVHFAPSDNVPLSDLVKISPIQIKLSKDRPIHQPLGSLSIEIRRWQLPWNRGFSISPPVGSKYEYQIENTLFKVRSPVPIVDWGKHVTDMDACFQSWKISIISTADKKAYDVNGHKDWGVSALRVDHGWHPTLTWELALNNRK